MNNKCAITQTPTAYDLVVLGSGAAGLTAALTAADRGLSVLLLEKGEEVGGSTGLSSGVAWIPVNKYGIDAGFADTPEMVLEYLASLSHDLVQPEMAQAFVEACPELIDWLEERTPLKLKLVPGFPDYHPEYPGGHAQGGRSVEPQLFSFNELGEWAERVIGQPRHMLITETPTGGGAKDSLTDEIIQARKAGRIEGLGRALVGALLKGCLDKGVDVRTSARATDLVFEDGRVAGVRCETEAGSVAMKARHGVVIATGGFEQDADLVKAFLRGPIKHMPGASTNCGDGLRMAMRAGAMLGAMREAWWAPVVAIPDETRVEGTKGYLVEFERTMPGSIMVNRHGKRFTNEAASDNDLGGPFHQMDTHFNWVNNPSWLIFDQNCVENYGAFGIAAGQDMPEWVSRASSLEELALKLEIPTKALSETVSNWNDAVKCGRDEDFGRGDSAHDVWFGDRDQYPNRQATLGTLAKAPYYAVQVHISTLGTTGGPQTTPDCEVIGVDGSVISGLWAAGNAMASPTRMIYGGAGGSLGPAMVFGYRAGRHAAACLRSVSSGSDG